MLETIWFIVKLLAGIIAIELEVFVIFAILIGIFTYGTYKGGKK